MPISSCVALMRGNFILLTFAHSNDVALSESNREFIMGLASTLKFSATSYLLFYGSDEKCLYI